MAKSIARRSAALLATGCLAVTALVPAATEVTGQAAATTTASVRPVPMARLLSRAHWDAPPTTAQCEATKKIACYSPAQLQRAYGLDKLYAKGFTGKGSTIAIVDAFGTPTAVADLKQFDKDFGLPDPKLTIIQPAGKVPAYDPTNGDMVGWAQETSLDLQWAHAVAPEAKLLLVETPVAETEGVQGFPEIVQAENYVVDHRLADVISQSFGATEETFPTAQSLLRLRSAFKNAARHHVSVLASSGDDGAAGVKLDGETYYRRRVNSWPSSDPLVTSVGGTQLHLDAVGNRTQPDNVWNDTALFGGPAASGGTVSGVFARPAYQDGVRSVVHAHRGTPDISMNAAVDGGVLVYTSFGGYAAGYHVFGGTSAATPEFAGVVAIARQRAGHRLGLLNGDLYGLAGKPGIVDVTAGDNTVAFEDADGSKVTIKGYAAVPGYDLATGLGTVNAPALTRELANRAR